MTRPSRRNPNETRAIIIETDVNCHAEGSCLISFGKTKVLCTASFEDSIPRFLKGSGKGWLTAQYGMLPRSTHSRMQREAASGKQSGRTQEIQRLIGRSLRAAIDLEILGERQITIDCDVIQADGGTRTAAISGGYVALAICIERLLKEGTIHKNPLKHNIAAISCGIWKGTPVADLDYDEDSNIDVDANFVFTSKGEIVEIQGSAEGDTFSKEQLLGMYELAENACDEIFDLQNEAVKNSVPPVAESKAI